IANRVWPSGCDLAGEGQSQLRRRLSPCHREWASGRRVSRRNDVRFFTSGNQGQARSLETSVQLGAMSATTRRSVLHEHDDVDLAIMCAFAATAHLYRRGSLL